MLIARYNARNPGILRNIIVPLNNSTCLSIASVADLDFGLSAGSELSFIIRMMTVLVSVELPQFWVARAQFSVSRT